MFPKRQQVSIVSIQSLQGRTTRTDVWAYMRAKGSEVGSGLLSERVIFGSLLFLIGLAAVPFGSVDPWWEGIFESAIFVLGVCCVVTNTIGKRWHVPVFLAPIIGLVLVGCLQLLPLSHTAFRSGLLPGGYQTISVDPFETKRFVIKLLAVALTLAMLLRYTASRQRLVALMDLVIIVGAASALFAIWRWLLPATALTAVWDDKLKGDSFGQFVNRNHFALLMEMSLGPALGMALSTGHGFKRYFYVATAFLICLTLILANSRGGIISMLGQLGFLSWMYFGTFVGLSFGHHAMREHPGAQRFWHRSCRFALRCALSLLLLGAVFSIVLWLGGDTVRQRLESVPGEFLARKGDLANKSPRRLEIWGATWRLIRAHPVLGSGLGAYKTAITEYLPPPNDWRPQQAHNEYLELVAGGGLIGGAFGFWFVLYIIREARKRLHDTDALRRAVCLGALVGLVGVAIHSLVDFGLHVMVNALVCCGLVALVTAKIRSAQIESQSLQSLAI